MSDTQGEGLWLASDGGWYPPELRPPKQDPSDIYKTYRGQIEAESNLVGVRLGWMMTAEAFLLAAYATVLTVPPSMPPTKFDTQANHLYVYLPVAGIVLSALVWVSIWAALRAMGTLSRDYQKEVVATDVVTPINFPDIVVKRKVYWAGSAAPALIPPLTIAGWIFLLLASR